MQIPRLHIRPFNSTVLWKHLAVYSFIFDFNQNEKDNDKNNYSTVKRYMLPIIVSYI